MNHNLEKEIMMARGKKKTEPEDQGEKVKPQDVKAVISAGKLKRLMSAKRSTTKDMHELMGVLGQSIKDACDNDHLHRKAFSVICTLDKMENEKIADFLDHFNYYLDAGGIQKRADSVMRMNLKDEAQEDKEGETDPDDTNVHRLAS